MNRRQRTDRMQQPAKSDVVTDIAVVQGQVAIDNDSRWLYRPGRNLADTARKILRHIYAAVNGIGIRGDMCIRKKKYGVLVAGFSKPSRVTMRRQRCGSACKGGALDECAARKLGKSYRHTASRLARQLCAQFRGNFPKRVWHYPGIRNNRHEICVAGPARHNMNV